MSDAEAADYLMAEFNTLSDEKRAEMCALAADAGYEIFGAAVLLETEFKVSIGQVITFLTEVCG